LCFTLKYSQNLRLINVVHDKKTSEETGEEGVYEMWRFSLLAEAICASEEGIQNVELDEYKEKKLVVIRKYWSLKKDVKDFWYLSTGNRDVRKNFN
jgi:hypothetical protein